jgi:predicted nucleic acid-binding protein
VIAVPTPSPLLILDTNVLVHLLRNNAVGQAIEKTYSLTTRPERPLLSSIVEGELRGLAESWNWGTRKIQTLETTLSELVRISAGEPEVVAAYGELYAHQSKIGKRVGENDLWIAATARAINGTVLTCDTDFLSFDQVVVNYIHFPT